jgi:exodeoxyribonuclease VII small subunit
MSEFDGLSFEAAYGELESILQQLDTGALPLEDSVTLFERGRKLADYCQSLLDSAELRVNQLLEGGRVEPF